MADQETPADPARTVPKVLLTAWGAAPAARKGPRPKLTVARILETAIALGDQGGTEAVTMSRTAAALGVGTMSLYRYVESRSDLLLLAADAVLGAPPEPEGRTWRERTHSLARAMRSVFRRHPWASQIPVTVEPLAPSYVRWAEAGLAALEETGLDIAERARVMTLVWTYVRAEGELAEEQRRAWAAEGLDPADAHRAFVHRLDTLVGADDFPRVRALLGSDLLAPGPAPHGEDGADEAEFARSVDLVLDGVEARAARG
ncbi:MULTISPECIES: TetR/AcrR family transcriptional regulator C-terminal domain-containing protein [unclassified Nocardiopsis]|uniref:TetR/AcrR family transcriptional regulator n=1 Tax=unclassified Nocardiopsis TaxID=2649073 RepID=UPI0033E0F473